MRNMTEEKRRLRDIYSAARATMKSPEKDEAICRNFLSLFSRERNFFIYLAFRTEAETKGIIEGLEARGAKVCVPKIVEGNMLAVPLSGELQRNRFGILEPDCGEDEPVEVAAVPLLAVDEKGVRLGYGGGYYDKYFAAHKNVLRVGLCYAGQAVPALPREKTDLPLHAVVTEEGVRFFAAHGLTAKSRSGYNNRKL